MVQRSVITLLDDLDGTVLTVGTGETIRFGLNRSTYEIDLTADHAAALREMLRPFIEAGRRSAAPASPRRGRRPVRKLH